MADIPNFDLDSLVKTATSGPDTSWVQPAVKKLESIESEREKATEPVLKDMQKRSSEDRAEVDKSKPDDVNVEPWKAKLPEANPIQAFGSFGSVFAVLASAFTHTPMISALNGAAAAINAVRANDVAAYKDAYQAWKDNSELAVKRHDIQYKDYLAAMDKMKTDAAEGHAMLAEIGAKYGDQKSAVLAEAGLYEKLDSLWQSRQSAAVGLLEAIPRIEEQNLTVGAVLELNDARSDLTQAQKIGDPSQVEDAQKRVQEAEQKVRDIAMSKYVATYGAAGAGHSPQAVALNQFIDQWRTEHDGQDPPAEETAKFLSSMRGASPGNLQTQIVNQRIAEKEKQIGRPLTGEEKTQEAAAVKRAGMTGNQMAKLQERVDQFDNSSDRIEQATQILEKHIGAAGIAGRALRVKEAVGNILGSDETDRAQFRRDIEYLQAMSHRLLTDASGRPLSSDAQKLDNVIGGLNLGDTTANTLRSLGEIKRLYAKMRTDTLLELKGDWMPREDRDGGAGSPLSPPARDLQSDQPWLSDPVVK